MDALPWPQFGIGSGWLLVGFFVWLVLTGRLKPKADLDDANHRADIKDQQIQEKDVQLRYLLEVGKTVDAIMRSIHRNAQSGDRGSHEEDS